MNKFIFFILLLFPVFVFADAKTYTDDSGIAQMGGDFIADFWALWETDLPNIFVRAYAWILQKSLEMKIYAQIELMKLSWAVAKEIINNFQIGSKITASLALLDSDTRQILIDLKIIDGFNLLLNAMVARFVMKMV
jgi:hypothetical protein